MAAFDFTGDDDAVFAQVRHALEGEEISLRKWYFADGTERVVEDKTFGPQRWIRRVHERGILTPIQLLALILFALWDIKDPSQNDRKIVADWNRALTDAMGRGEICARDRDSLLPLANADGADWVISLDDADAFVTARGTAWTCTEIAAHLFNEFFGEASPDATLSSTAPKNNDATPPAGPPADADDSPHGARAPQPQAVNANGRIVHRTGRRTTALDAVIEMAKGRAVAPDDWQSVWAALVKLAQGDDRPAPLTGYAEGEGVLYQVNDDPCKAITKQALAARLRRRRASISDGR
ncbi:hypothetical protein LL998_06615 [Burkholderia ambifaria]|uniref:hypothetical protein n=1 Tax=Burkholderia ambifaria TaxID=152480 RepID=UPI001E49E725|nr:hypothetical protein [Burkholderia ambifaria]UEP35957.1 hypothetical protein LL998_06615 [Burkholderia ambifaria]